MTAAGMGLSGLCVLILALGLLRAPDVSAEELLALGSGDKGQYVETEPRRHKGLQLAQFALPPAASGGKTAPPPLPSVLRYSYVWGVELEVPYTHNLDLNSDLEDTQVLGAPTLFGSFTYRPAHWLEFMVEATLEKLVSIREEETTVLPDGSLQNRDPKPWSLLIDQLYGKVDVPDTPLSVTAGRRGFLDPRLWLYDVEMDGIILTAKPGTFTFEASVTRLDAVDLDLLTHVPKQHTNNYTFYAEYRGIEDHQLGAYFMLRDHPPSAGEGRPQFMGVSAVGRPSDSFNWWAQAAYLDGRDEDSRKFQAFGVDVGATYRFTNVWLQPTLTLGFAYGSGDSDPNDGTNKTFRQTGLQSNEGRFAGVTQFLYYGEALDPELSNLQIYTAGFGIRPEAGTFLELVYHHYRLNAIAQEIRGWALSTAMNETPGQTSKEVGNELDVIIGFRNILGIRGLGAEFRLGFFFPGEAFASGADVAISGLGVIFF